VAYRVAGCRLTLDDIEHGRVRARARARARVRVRVRARVRARARDRDRVRVRVRVMTSYPQDLPTGEHASRGVLVVDADPNPNFPRP
jgi:hypothetical protein